MGVTERPKGYKMRVASVLTMGGPLVLRVSVAHAATLDDVIQTVTSSSALTFGTGVAAGAVCAGLVALLLHARTKKKFRAKEEQYQQAAHTASEEIRLANKRIAALKETVKLQEDELDDLREREEAYGKTQVLPILEADELGETAVTGVLRTDEQDQMDQPTPDVDQDDEQLDETQQIVSNEEEQTDVADEQPEDVEEVLDEVEQQPNFDFVATDAEELESADVLTSSEDDEESPYFAEEFMPEEDAELGFEDQDVPIRRNVRLVLDERLTPDAFNESGGMRRASMRSSDIPAFLSHRRARQYDPVVRASLIDQRVPRFDESLYPDTVTHMHEELDVFETAMRALEDTLQHTAVLGIEEDDDILYLHPEDRMEIVDAAAYVDYLIQDEMEKTMSGEPLPTSHAHLTMFEGTGDLNISKKLGKYRPRHMRAASREA